MVSIDKVDIREVITPLKQTVTRICVKYNGHFGQFFEGLSLEDAMKEFGEWYKNQP